MFHLDRSTILGTAGEHLVCADLIQQGYVAFMTAAALPYDVVLDTGHALLRVQVKAAVAPRARSGRRDRPVYRFSRGDAEADILAFVALDIGRVAYLAWSECPTALHLDGPVPAPYTNKKGPRPGCRTFAEFPLDLALGWHHNKRHVDDRPTGISYGKHE